MTGSQFWSTEKVSLGGDGERRQQHLAKNLMWKQKKKQTKTMKQLWDHHVFGLIKGQGVWETGGRGIPSPWLLPWSSDSHTVTAHEWTGEWIPHIAMYWSCFFNCLWNVLFIIVTPVPMRVFVTYWFQNNLLLIKAIHVQKLRKKSKIINSKIHNPCLKSIFFQNFSFGLQPVSQYRSSLTYSGITSQ